ncbi:MAG: PssE/Cps14G family polysaccharide biosynthesis glycosyltransferase [Nanoarchaeota archaeon]|nr:beta-1,4-galactosyltransferase [Nanoarchaeota archaeon]MBU4300102.1 beta-1,4-galactosyltransferase [Nanoarchaeota archaeon]MBU4452304.1 beta-1,4-galactosyltransferase [Nanoarchaeota archaeon]MCG2723829.1 beta-1,4-galactosyltransferase [archaeon]
MIFVTVGTHTQGFERLIMAVDSLVGQGLINEPVTVQIGNTKYEPKNCAGFRFESFEHILELNRTADIVITHAGAGCILTAMQFKKPLIIVPRYKKFGEHVNDHQCDLAAALDKKGKAVVLYDINGLLDALERVKKLQQEEGSSKMVEYLRKYLAEIGIGDILGRRV